VSKEPCNPGGLRLVMPPIPAVPMPPGRPPGAGKKPEQLVSQEGRGAGLPVAAQEGASGPTPAVRPGAGADRVQGIPRDTKEESGRAEDRGRAVLRHTEAETGRAQGRGQTVLGEMEAVTPDIPAVERQEEAAKERLGFPLQILFRS
jgi:hypothetical protein